MNNNSLKIRIPLAALALFCILSRPAAAADAPPVSPLPLAQNAKAKPDEFPEQRRAREMTALNVRMNLLLGTRDYDAIEKTVQEWQAQYRAKTLSADDYLKMLEQVAPSKAGKGMLSEVLAWTKSRPTSYAAWYTLGVLYYDIAWEERGTRYANQTSEAQFEAMRRYARLSQEALVKSLSLNPAPLPSHVQLIRVATITGAKHSGGLGVLESILPGQKRFCPAKYAADGVYPSLWDEQLYYFCLALKSDPNAVEPFANIALFNTPRWGGSYPRLEKLLEEVRGDRRSEARALGAMQARLLAMQALDAAGENDAHRAAELYMQAFRAAPAPEHVKWMYEAAMLERNKVKNADRAMALFTEVAAYRAGEAHALANIGFIYDERGDVKRYMDYMIPAANLGLKEAQNNLGYYYMVGQRGLPRDLVQAKAWLTLAANQGFEHAREKLGLVDSLIAQEAAKKK